MLKSGIDQQALIAQFARASAQQTAQLQAAVTEATLKALAGREMSLKNIRSVVKSVTEAASQGAAGNLAPQVDLPALLHSAVAEQAGDERGLTILAALYDYAEQIAPPLD